MDRKTKFRLDLPTENSKIYDHFYGKFAQQKNYKITAGYKTQLVADIMNNLSHKEQEAIRLMVRHQGYNIKGNWWKNNEAARKKDGTYSYKELAKNYDLACKHMYSPQNISLAVRGYYTIRGKKTRLLESDFGLGNKYIMTALNKAGIEYKEQLMKHLSNGWYYLWTIPGCGDNARQKILKAIDKWEGRE